MTNKTTSIIKLRIFKKFIKVFDNALTIIQMYSMALNNLETLKIFKAFSIFMNLKAFILNFEKSTKSNIANRMTTKSKTFILSEKYPLIPRAVTFIQYSAIYIVIYIIFKLDKKNYVYISFSSSLFPGNYSQIIMDKKLIRTTTKIKLSKARDSVILCINRLQVFINPFGLF